MTQTIEDTDLIEHLDEAIPCAWHFNECCGLEAQWAIWLDPDFMSPWRGSSDPAIKIWLDLCALNPFFMCTDHKNAYLNDRDTAQTVLRVEAL